ncbi:MAG: DUF885 family protein [Bacteroidota bacterium]
MNYRNAVIILFLLLQTNCFVLAQYSDPNSLYSQTSEMHNTMVHYDADLGSINRYYTVTDDMYAWQYENYFHSPECRKRLLKLNDDYLEQIDGLDFDKMNINGKVDFILFKRNLEEANYKLIQEGNRYNQISKLIPFSSRIYELQVPRRRGDVVDGEKFAKTLNEINKEIKKRIGDAKKDSISMEMELARAASAAIKDLQSSLKNVFDFYNGYDPMFTWWVPKTYAETDSILLVYEKILASKGKRTVTQKEDGSGIVGRPIGKQELIRQLQSEFIPYTPEELVMIANKEFAYCDAELLKASKEMGFGNNWKAAQEKVKTMFVAPGKQPQAMFDLYMQSVEFLKKNDLVTIPTLSEETWRMSMMAPERQLVNPFFLGGEELIISYPTNTMSYDDKLMSMRGNNPQFSRATVHHELIAGHHLQQYMTNRNKTYRHFSTPFWGEGYSLYWEMLLWDLNFPIKPEDKIGMLFWRMHRCARIIFSLNYHLGKWSPQECIDFLVDRVGHERANAEGEVRRSFVGGYSPLYQIAYMLGGLQIMSLKRELVDSKKMTYRQFHDALFAENDMPIEMLRAILINQPLTKNFRTTWRFYDVKTGVN